MPQWFWDNYSDKNHARELNIIYQAMQPILKDAKPAINSWYSWLENRSQIAEACELIHKKYWQRFHKFYFFPKIHRLRCSIPTMNRTQALKEFLAMGFVYKTDYKVDQTLGYYIFSHIGGLWWPQRFKHHQDAIEKMKVVGIPGLTGTTTIKDK